MKLGGWLFCAIVCVVFIDLSSMPGPGEDGGVPQSAAPSTAPVPDSGLAPVSTVTPSVSPPVDQQQKPPDQAPAPVSSGDQASAQAASAGDELKPTQLKWPDALELKEEVSGQLTASDPAIVNIYGRSEVLLSECTKISQQFLKDQNDLSTKFADIANKIDEFFQDATIQRGRIMRATEDLSKDKKE